MTTDFDWNPDTTKFTLIRKDYGNIVEFWKEDGTKFIEGRVTMKGGGGVLKTIVNVLQGHLFFSKHQ